MCQPVDSARRGIFRVVQQFVRVRGFTCSLSRSRVQRQANGFQNDVQVLPYMVQPVGTHACMLGSVSIGELRDDATCAIDFGTSEADSANHLSRPSSLFYRSMASWTSLPCVRVRLLKKGPPPRNGAFEIL